MRPRCWRYSTPSPAARLAAALILLATGMAACHADETTRRVQEELRKRNLYFGDIDGRSTPQVEAALKRFQQRKGLSGSGAADPDTLRLLGIPVGYAQQGAQVEESWPEAPVLRSEAARENVPQNPELSEPVEAPPEPFPEMDPEPVGEHEVEARTGTTETGSQADRSASQEALTPPGGQTPRAAKNDRSTDGPPRPETTPASKSGPPGDDLAGRAKKAIRQYLQAAESSDVRAELKFYGDKVDYFDHGTVGTEFIERDVARYRARWPRRDYTLLGVDARPSPGKRDEVEVRFRIGFKVSNGSNTVKGKTDNRFRFQEHPDGLRLVSMWERRVRE